MTPAQLAALQSYIASVVRLMTRQGDHASNVRLMLDSKKTLEAAFGMPLDYPDLFGETPAPQPKSGFPDLL
jgi:hypothetical protein